MAVEKKIKYDMQGGVRNYLGKQKEIKAPLKWQSGPNHPSTELAYITKKEKDLLIKSDLHNSLKNGANRGPSGIMSLNGWGDSSDGFGSTGTGGQTDTGDLGSETANDASLSAGNKSVGYGGNDGDPRTGGGVTTGGFLGKIGTTVKDYVMGGGILGAGIRGLTGLYDKVTGPPDLGIKDGYNMANIAGPRSFDFGPEDQGNDNQGIMAAYNPYMFKGAGEVEEEVPVSQEEEDFIQRYRVANQFRQDKQGQLDPAILEMISKLYT